MQQTIGIEQLKKKYLFNKLPFFSFSINIYKKQSFLNLYIKQYRFINLTITQIFPQRVVTPQVLSERVHSTVNYLDYFVEICLQKTIDRINVTVGCDKVFRNKFETINVVPVYLEVEGTTEDQTLIWRNERIDNITYNKTDEYFKNPKDGFQEFIDVFGTTLERLKINGNSTINYLVCKGFREANLWFSLNPHHPLKLFSKSVDSKAAQHMMPLGRWLLRKYE